MVSCVVVLVPLAVFYILFLLLLVLHLPPPLVVHQAQAVLLHQALPLVPLLLPLLALVVLVLIVSITFLPAAILLNRFAPILPLI